jgi:predicted small lipoprotein YifL
MLLLSWEPFKEVGLACDRLRRALALIALGAAALSLAACGRVGPLQPPPGPAVAAAPTASATPPGAPAPTGPVASAKAAPENAQTNGFDAYGNPVAPAGQKRSFPLDFLLH